MQRHSIRIVMLAVALVASGAPRAFAEDKAARPGKSEPAKQSRASVRNAEAAKTGAKAGVANKATAADKGEAAEKAGAPAKDDKREVKVELKDLPSTVHRTLARESYGGQVLEVERETKAGKTTYEADVRLDGSTYEVRITAEGKLLSKTLDDDDDDEGDDDDGDDDGDDDDDDNDVNPAARPAAAAARAPAKP